MSKKNYSIELVADMLSTSKYVVNQWVKNKSIRSIKPNGKTYIPKNELKKFDKLSFLFSKNKFKKQKPKKNYKIIELFAGCGGLALGLEKAGFKCVMSNDIDKDSCDTLKFNRPKWNVLHKDISKISNKEFLGYKDVDVVSGLKQGGHAVVNCNTCPNLKSDSVHYVDATEIAIKHLKKPIVNTAMLGAFAKVTNVVKLDSLKQAVLEKFGESNVKALEECYAGVKK